MKKWAMALGVLALCACNDNASDKQAVSNTTPPPAVTTNAPDVAHQKIYRVLLSENLPP